MTNRINYLLITNHWHPITVVFIYIVLLRGIPTVLCEPTGNITDYVPQIIFDIANVISPDTENLPPDLKEEPIRIPYLDPILEKIAGLLTNFPEESDISDNNSSSSSSDSNSDSSPSDDAPENMIATSEINTITNVVTDITQSLFNEIKARNPSMGDLRRVVYEVISSSPNTSLWCTATTIQEATNEDYLGLKIMNHNLELALAETDLLNKAIRLHMNAQIPLFSNANIRHVEPILFIGNNNVYNSVLSKVLNQS